MIRTVVALLFYKASALLGRCFTCFFNKPPEQPLPTYIALAYAKAIYYFYQEGQTTKNERTPKRSLSKFNR
ncbi:MAG: hypothetical protein RLZ12_936 [Bacillota bacterium]|jgi:hypothetical protein